MFFLDSGCGRDFETGTMAGEDLQGWLVPEDRANEFEKIWCVNDEDDSWTDFYCFVKWICENDEIDIAFVGETGQMIK